MSLSKLLVGEYQNRIFVLISSLVIVSLVIDLLISNLSRAINIATSWSIGSFIIITVVYITGQYFILRYVRGKSKSIRNRSALITRLDRVVTLTQYIIMVLPIAVILQILTSSNYSTGLLTWGVPISYVLSTAIIGILAARFFRWYQSNKNFIVLLYALASVAVAIRVAITGLFYVPLLFIAPSSRNAQSEVAFQPFEPTSVLQSLNDAYVTSSSIAFMLMWIATAALLRNYYQKTTNIKYWIIVAIIPAYAISDYFISDEIIAQSIGFDTASYELFITFQGVGAGVLISVPFWFMSAGVGRRSRQVRNYMTITAIGIILFFIASSVTIDHAPYPPFGFLLILSIGLSSYLMLVGLYSSAVSVSSDSDLRRYMKTTAANQSKLLDSIALGEVLQQIENQVKEKSDQISDETGVEPTLDENEVKDYMEQVLREVEKSKVHEKRENSSSDDIP